MAAGAPPNNKPEMVLTIQEPQFFQMDQAGRFYHPLSSNWLHRPPLQINRHDTPDAPTKTPIAGLASCPHPPLDIESDALHTDLIYQTNAVQVLPQAKL